MRSRFGLRLMAVRDDEFAAAELGVNGFRVKLIALTVSACLVGLAGSMNAFQQLSLEPYSAFSISWAINMILACVIGGLATVPGPLIGAAVMFELQQILQGSSDLPPIIEGVVLLAIIRFAPGGIWGLVRDGLARLRRADRRPELSGRSAEAVGRRGERPELARNVRAGREVQDPGDSVGAASRSSAWRIFARAVSARCPGLDQRG